MWIHPEIRALLEAKKYDALEEMWMEHLDETTPQLEIYREVLTGLHGAGERDRALALLELLCESLRERDAGAAELEIMLLAVALWPDAPELRAPLLQALRRVHADCPSLDRLVQHFKLVEAREPAAVLAQMQPWLRFDVGRRVVMQGRGTGRVVEINLSLGTLRVEFDPSARLALRLAEAEKLLMPLGPGHFLLDKIERPDELRQLAETDPGELLRRLFTSLERGLSVTELRQLLAGIVPEERWTAWWKSARQDPRLTAGGGTRPLFSWSESGEAADAALRIDFENAPPRQRLELARKHGARSPEMASLMSKRLAETARTVRRSDPALALESLLLLEKLTRDAPDIDFEPGDLLPAGDPLPIVTGVQERGARERAFELLRARADWTELYAQLLRSESDARLLGVLYEALAEAKPERLAAVVDESLARPHTAPRLFLWLCREPRRRDLILARDPWSLLRRLLEAQDAEAFRSVRVPLRELFDRGGLADLLAARLSAEQAEQLLAILERDMGLEAHRKEDLRHSVQARFPELREAQEEVLYTTPEALERKRTEFDQIVRVDIPHNAEEIRKAAAHGDLRENFEYKAARDRHEMLSSQAKRLHDEIRRARALEPATIDATQVRVGTRVRLRPQDDAAERRTLTILGPWDSDPAAGVLSYLARAVQPMLGKRAGETVRLGDADFVIEDIEVWRPLGA